MPEERDGYRWVMLSLFVLMCLIFWMAWFAQAPLLSTYWDKVCHIGAATGNLLLSLPGLVAIGLGVSSGRWIDTVGVRKLLGIGAVCALTGFGLRPLFMTSFAAQAVLTTVGGYGIIAEVTCLGPLMIQWFGRENAHTYIGIGGGSFFIGGGLGITLTVTLLQTHSVVDVFWLYSGLMLVITVLWGLLARDKKAGPAAARPAFAREFKAVMQAPSAWVNLTVCLFMGGATVFAMGFLPTQMTVSNKLAPAVGGAIAGLFPIAMGTGMIVLPPLAGRWGRKLVALVFMAVTLMVWLAYLSRPSWGIGPLILAAVIFGFFFEVPWGLSLSMQESMPGVTPANMGVAAGIFTVSQNVGVFFGPLIMGAFVDRLGVSGGSWALFAAYLSAFLALVFVKEYDSGPVRRPKPDLPTY